MISLGRAGLTIRVSMTPVTINWTFAILVALYIRWLDRPWQYGLMFAGVALFGIIWHEIGHAVGYRLVGRSARIIVHGLGGVTISDEGDEMEDPEGAGVALAGPLVGISIGLIALWLQVHDVGEGARWSRALIEDMILVNLGWGILNLVPIVPLDGGQVVASVTGKIAPRLRDTLPYLLSIATGVAGIVVAWRYGLVLAVLIAALLVGLNIWWLITSHRVSKQERADLAAAAAVERAAGVPPEIAVNELCSVLAAPLNPDIERRAADTLAWILATRMGPGDGPMLTHVINRLAGRQDTALLAAAAAADRYDRPAVIALLTRAFAVEGTPPPTWLVTRLLPSTDDAMQLAAAIDRLGLGERHDGLGRLVASLERSGRPADAISVRALMARPVATATFGE